MTKGARGEAILSVDGREYPILFTNRALAEAEQRTGKTITALASSAGQGLLGIGETAALLVTGLEAARKASGLPGRATQMQDAYSLLDAAGFGNVAAAVYEAIAAVLGYDPDKGASDDADDAERPTK